VLASLLARFRPGDDDPVEGGHLALGAAVAAYEQWLADETSDLGVLLAEAFRTWQVNAAP